MTRNGALTVLLALLVSGAAWEVCALLSGGTTFSELVWSWLPGRWWLRVVGTALFAGLTYHLFWER